jgi:hypothetical protein
MFRDPLSWFVACAKFRVAPIRRPATLPADAAGLGTT